MIRPDKIFMRKLFDREIFNFFKTLQAAGSAL